jgi:glycosyltransferase involved in cell wall biosynthesis
LRFSIIIPFLRGKREIATLLPCLQSCLNQAGYEQFAEVRVVTNFPEPGLSQMLESLLAKDRLFLDCVGARGVNRARNLGVRNSRGDLLLFLDDDCQIPHADFLRELSWAFRQRPDFSALGGPYVSPPSSSWMVRGYNAMATAWIRLHARSAGPDLFSTGSLLGGNACYRRDLFFKSGLSFDENFISGGDESEFNLRLTRLGYRLGFSERLSVIHRAADGWRPLFYRAIRQGRARTVLPSAAPIFRLATALAFLRMIRGEPSAFLFSLAHFPVLFFQGVYRKRNRSTIG